MAQIVKSELVGKVRWEVPAAIQAKVEKEADPGRKLLIFDQLELFMSTFVAVWSMEDYAEGSSEAFERFDNLLSIMAEPHAEFIQRVQDEKAQAA